MAKPISPISRMIAELKALSMAATQDKTRGTIAGLYVEYRPEDANKSFFIVATDGNIMVCSI